jgi:mannose/fructose/N-acetylgalactosamine-specific phosphotransferase system component IID
MERIIGAFTFREGVYAEVEKDTDFTTTAWILVAVVAFLNQLGSQATSEVGSLLIGAIVGTVFAVIGFAVGALIINFVGRTVYNADVTFAELVRTLGLAYVWNVIGVLGILAALAPALGCLLVPVMIAAWVAMAIAWFRAAREALDLETGQTLITVILGWLAPVVIMIVAGAVLAGLGLGAAALGGLLGGGYTARRS